MAISSDYTGNFDIIINNPSTTDSTYPKQDVVDDPTSLYKKTLTVPITIKSQQVSMSDVLKGITSLIASINKQIAALQKALLKK